MTFDEYVFMLSDGYDNFAGPGFASCDANIPYGIWAS